VAEFYKPDSLIRILTVCTAMNEDAKSFLCLVHQVKSGSIFDNVLVTDDEKFAEEFGEKTWGASKDGEKKMKEGHDEEERKQREEEEKNRKDGQYTLLCTDLQGATHLENLEKLGISTLVREKLGKLWFAWDGLPQLLVTK